MAKNCKFSLYIPFSSQPDIGSFCQTFTSSSQPERKASMGIRSISSGKFSLPTCINIMTLTYLHKGRKNKYHKLLFNLFLCVDYNTIFKLLVELMKISLSLVYLRVHEDQIRFKPKCCININTFFDIQESLQLTNLSCCALLVDIEKTYDSVNFTYLEQMPLLERRKDWQ